MRTKSFFVALALTAALSQPAASIPIVSAEISPAAIAKFEKRAKSNQLPADTSYSVVDTFNSNVLTSKSATEPQLSASVMKLVTAAVALQTFGYTHQLHTKVTQDGKHLFIVGGGDALMNRGDLKTLAKKTARAIDSDRDYKLFVDGSLFESHTDPAGWLSSYVPGEVRPIASLAIYGSRSTSPAKEAAKVFVDELRNHGVEVYFAGTKTHSGTLVTDIKSLRMAKLVKEMLENSNNDTAEMLFHLIGTVNGQTGSWESARIQTRKVLKTLGINRSNWNVVDGSGLSRANRLTSKGLTDLLMVSLQPDHPNLNQILKLGLLPQGGTEGTLKLRFKESRSKCAAKFVQAKTGTLSDTVGLAGYVQSKDGGMAAFAILANQLPSRSWQNTVRSRIDYMVTALSGCDSAL